MGAAIQALVQPDSELRRGLDELGMDLPEAIQVDLLGYLALLAKWNRVYNLTSVRDPRDMLAVHLLDSLSIVPLIDRERPSTVLDVGSGAGLPGIPLAVARPSMFVTTVDAVAKKISFQQQCKATLGVENLAPLHHRVEALTLAKPPDLIVSRAYATLSTMLQSVRHLAGPDTTIVAMKGMTPLDELASLAAPWTLLRVEPLEVPFLGAQRCAVVIRKS